MDFQTLEHGCSPSGKDADAESTMNRTSIRTWLSRRAPHGPKLEHLAEASLSQRPSPNEVMDARGCFLRSRTHSASYDVQEIKLMMTMLIKIAMVVTMTIIISDP